MKLILTILLTLGSAIGMFVTSEIKLRYRILYAILLLVIGVWLACLTSCDEASWQKKEKGWRNQQEIQSLWQAAMTRDDSLRHLYIELAVKDGQTFAHLYPFQITLEITSAPNADPFFKINYSFEHIGRPGEHNRISQFKVLRTVSGMEGEIKKDEYTIARVITTNQVFQLELKNEIPFLRSFKNILDTSVEVGLSPSLFKGLEQVCFVANEWTLIDAKTEGDRWTAGVLRKHKTLLSSCYKQTLPPRADFREFSLLRPDISFELHSDEPIPFNAPSSVYDSMIAKNPNDSYALQKRGDAYLLREGQENLAIQDYNKALENDPQIVPVLFNLGLIYLQRGDNTLARDYCLRAIAIDPEKDKAYPIMGFACTGLELYDEAITHLSKAIQYFPDESLVWEHRGFSYRQLGQYQNAVRDYLEVLQLTPENERALINLGWLSAKLGQYGNAVTYYLKAKRSGVLSQEDSTLLIEAWENLTDPPEIVDACSEILSQEPDNLNALNHRGAAFFRMQHFERSVADYSRALEIDENFSPARFNRGIVFGAMGKIENARSDFDRVLREAPDTGSVYYFLGILNEQASRIEDAKNAYRTFLQAPEFLINSNMIEVASQRLKALSEKVGR